MNNNSRYKQKLPMADIVITSIETINAFDITTGDHLSTLDELRSASIAQGQEKVDITGKMENGNEMETL